MVPVTLNRPGDNRCLLSADLNSGGSAISGTMTRTGAVPRLMQHIAEPMVEVAPQDAVRYQLSADGLARIWSRHGVMVAKAISSARSRFSRCLFRCTGTTSFRLSGR